MRQCHVNKSPFPIEDVVSRGRLCTTLVRVDLQNCIRQSNVAGSPCDNVKRLASLLFVYYSISSDFGNLALDLLPHLSLFTNMNSSPRISLAGEMGAGLIDGAERVMRAVGAWKKGRVYSFAVPQCREKIATATYSDQFEGDYWVARQTEFRELDPSTRRAVFDLLMRYSAGKADLDHCHTQYEKEYIEELVQIHLTEHPLAGAPAHYSCFSYLAQLEYKLQWPLLRRRFCNLILVAWHESGNSAYVISLAVSPEVAGARPGNFVEAQYSAVEHIEFDPESGSLKWTMATCSDAKGHVPAWLARMSMNGVVAQDVAHFLRWAETTK